MIWLRVPARRRRAATVGDTRLVNSFALLALNVSLYLVFIRHVTPLLAPCTVLCLLQCICLGLSCCRAMKKIACIYPNKSGATICLHVEDQLAKHLPQPMKEVRADTVTHQCLPSTSGAGKASK